MKRVLTLIVLVGLSAGSASADLFTFSYSALTTSYDSTTGVFTANETINQTVGTFNRLVPPPSGPAVIIFDGVGFGDFALTMDITNVGAGGATADGINGTLAMKDVDGDTVSGTLVGDWAVVGSTLRFDGVLSNILYSGTGSGGDTWNGDLGSMSMLTGGMTGPWPGVFVELTAEDLRFDTSWTNVVGAGATATIVPVPGAVLLGFLGLGYAGMRLRKVA